MSNRKITQYIGNKKFQFEESEELSVRLYAIDLLGLFSLYVTTEHRHRSTCLVVLEGVGISGIDSLGGEASIRAIWNISRCLRSSFGTLPHAHSSATTLLGMLRKIADYFGSGANAAKTLSDESR